MRKELLLIEDREIGKDFKEFIETYLKDIYVFWVRNGKDAIKTINENNNIYVIVYDQRIENEIPELGTEIMKEIQKIKPDVIGIMLSAKASSDDVYDGMKNGIVFRYINKSDVSNLPECIIEAFNYHNLYSLEIYQGNQEPKLLLKKSSGLNLFKKYKVYLVSAILLEKNYYNDDDWEDNFILHAGQEKAEERQIERKTNIKVELSSKEEIELKSHLDLKTLNSVLVNEFSNRLEHNKALTKEESHADIQRLTNNLKMPPIPEDTSADYLTCLQFQSTQIYEKYLAVLKVECPYCNDFQITYRHIFIPTNRRKIRKVNTYKNKPQEVIFVY